MTFENLLKLEKECDTNPNYQHKGKTESEVMLLALRSFDKLAKKDQEVLISGWVERKLDPKACIRLRFKAQTNLFFLCKLLEKYKDLSDKEYTLNGEKHTTHEEICNGFFVRKDPTFASFEEFANDYKEVKDRLLLAPRGGFKSTIDMVDCIQWTICFPDLTMVIITGVLNLAKDFVKEIRMHFTQEQVGKDAKDNPIYGPRSVQDGTLSMFQVLFPEHCVREDDGRQNEFQTPACKLPDKEPTIRSASIEQSLSGWHFGILKLDDVVTNENCQTQGRMETVNKQVSINRALLHPFGFCDKVGTWYDEVDLYGVDIAYEEKLNKEGESPSMLIYLRAALWPTEEAKKLGKIEEEMTESDWVLWFPERLPYKFLIKEKKKDPEGFAIKYENDPRKAHQVKFPRELLIRRTVPAHHLPTQGMIVTTVDTAYSTKNFADYTVLITALIYGGNFYIIDMVRGRFNEYELPKVIAATGYKWKPKRIAIEDSVGVRWLSREIRREMDALGISVPIEYVSLGVGNKSKSKEIKARPVLRLLGDSRLYFSNSCNGLEELYNELEKFPKGSHDDIVSGLSILVDQFAAYADMEAKINVVSSDYVSDRQSKERHDLLYGLGRYSKFNVNFSLSEDNLTDMGNRQVKPTGDEPLVDPLADLM